MNMEKDELNIDELLKKPIWQMTGEELVFVLCQRTENFQNGEKSIVIDSTGKDYVYGLAGIAQLLGCSITTANRIKKSGRIDKAIRQIGRKIIVDANLAMELLGKKNGGRR